MSRVSIDVLFSCGKLWSASNLSDCLYSFWSFLKVFVAFKLFLVWIWLNTGFGFSLRLITSCGLFESLANDPGSFLSVEVLMLVWVTAPVRPVAGELQRCVEQHESCGHAALPPLTADTTDGGWFRHSKNREALRYNRQLMASCYLIVYMWVRKLSTKIKWQIE